MGALFEEHDVRTLLTDLRSVKMPPQDRRQVERLQARVVLGETEIAAVRALARRFRKQLAELHAARERARLSCGRQRIGMTLAQVEQARQERTAEVRREREDIGL